MILRIVLIINLLLAVRADLASAQIVSIIDSNLRAAIENALGKAPGASITPTEMATLPELSAPNANITDLTGLEAATNLKRLDLGAAYVAAEGRLVNSNAISDLSPLAGLTNLTRLHLDGNDISDISPLADLTNLVVLGLWNNSISDITAVAGLTNLFFLGLWDNNISDIRPLVSNWGLGEGEEVNVGENPLNDASINVHIPALQSRGVEVHFSNLKPALVEYLLSMPSGYNLIHIPLKVSAVDGMTRTITSIADLHDVLGGINAVKLIITLDSQTQEWFVYFTPADRNTPADRALTDEMGILVQLRTPVSVRLTGSPLGTDGNSIITLTPDYNLVGLPLKDPRLTDVSDLFTLEGIGGNSAVVFFTDNGEFKVSVRGEGPDDMPIIGGQAFILDTRRAAQVAVSGDGWTR